MRARRMGSERTTAVVTAEDAMAMLEPGDVLIDCTGANHCFEITCRPAPAGGGAPTRSRSGSSTRSSSPSCTASVTTATVLQYYKNAENPQYKFIPMVHRTHYDGSVSHVTGIVTSLPRTMSMPS